jgi:hypothetical protein
VWDQGRGDGTRGVRLRAIAGEPEGREWTPRMAPPEILSDEGTASYPSVAAAGDAALVTWTQGTPEGSDIRVRRFR